MSAWIARDPDGNCQIYPNRPVLILDIDDDGDPISYWEEAENDDPAIFWMVLGEDFHPEVTFENSPQEITLTIEDAECIVRKCWGNKQGNVIKAYSLIDIAMITEGRFWANNILSLLAALKSETAEKGGEA